MPSARARRLRRPPKGWWLLAPVWALSALQGVRCGDLPEGWFGAGALHLTAGTEDVDVELPARWPGGRRLAVSPLGDVDVRLERDASGRAGRLAILDLRGRGAEPLEVRLEVEVPLLVRPRAARFGAPAGDGVLLAIGDAGLDAARGVYEMGGDRGWDLSGIDGELRLSWLSTSRAAMRRGIRVVGPVAPGREVVVLEWEVAGGLRQASACSSPRASTSVSRGGWLFEAPVDGVGLVDALGPEADGVALEPLRWVELGDGWQKDAGKAFRGPARDWTATESRAFPDGAAALVRAIEARRGRPVLWLVPHGFAGEEAFAARPAAFLRDAEGRPLDDAFLGPLVVDPTAEAGREHLRALFESLSAQGWRAFRLGGLRHATEIYSRRRDRLSVATSGVEVVARSLETIRAACRGEVLLFGDLDTPSELFACLDAVRPARDPRLGVEPLRQVAAAAARWAPVEVAGTPVECLPVREWSASPDEDVAARSRASRLRFTALGGRSLLLPSTERPPGVGDSELAGALAPLAARPLDAFARSEAPGLWTVVLGDAPALRLVGGFNWSERSTRALRAEARDLALREHSVIAFDPIAEELVGATRLPLDLVLLPAESALRVVRPVTSEPALLWASGTVAEGVETLLAAGAPTSTDEVIELRGRARVRPTLDTRLHFWCPAGLRPRMVEAEGVHSWYRVDGRHLEVTLRAAPESSSRRVEWLVRFHTVDTPPPAAASRLELSIVLEPALRVPLLSWTSARTDGVRPGFWSVYRDGELRAIVNSRRWIDHEIRDHEEHHWTVVPEPLDRPVAASVPPADLSAVGGASASFALPAATEASVVDWEPTSVETAEWAPCRNRSIVGGPLRVRGELFERGLGVLAGTTVEHDLRGEYDVFRARVAVDDAARLRGSVAFVVVVDGEERFRSRLVTGGDEAALPVEVDVTGARALRLVVEDGGDGAAGDFANWLDPTVAVERD